MLPVPVVAAVILFNGRILLHQRKKGDALEGTWEFPGGKVEKGETPEGALKREIKEEIGLEIAVMERMGEVVHRYPHIYIRLTAYKAIPKGVVLNSTEGICHWVHPREVENYPLSPADRRLWRQIRDALDSK